MLECENDHVLRPLTRADAAADAGKNDACSGLSAGGGGTFVIHTICARSNQFSIGFL